MGKSGEQTEVVPAIRTVAELKHYLSDFYVIHDYMLSYDDYVAFEERIYTIIKGCYEYKALRKYPIKFKFYDDDPKFLTLELRHFIINLFYWYPFVELYDLHHVMSDEFIIDCYNDIPRISDRINDLILCLREYNVKNTIINYNISQVLYDLRRISGDFSMIMGLNFDMFTIINMYKHIPEFKAIMESKIDDKMQPSEIESFLKDKQAELITLLKSLPENPIGVILSSGTGIKDKQLAEFLIAQGLKPDLSGNTIPLPIKNSTVLGGLQTPSDLYIDGSGARKSVIMSHKVMGRAGHFGKVLTELARTLSLSTTITDCGTKHLVQYYVRDKKFLQKLNGKYFTLKRNDFSSLRPINAKKDTDLIGKVIYVRSIITCALENCTCSECFGLTASLNFDIADGIGAFSSEETAKVIEQNILSTKHLLTTISESIVFNDDFNKFFNINADEINPLINESELDNINEWVIEIPKSSLVKNDDMDSDEGYNTYIQDGGFRVKNIKTGVYYDIKEANNKELYLTDDCLQLMKKGKGLIYFKDMDDDTLLFIISIMNNELTKPLYELMNLVNTDKSGSVDRTIDNIAQRFVELLIDAKIDASANSAEIIINRLIRREDNIFERPDFSHNRMPNYKIVTVAKALEKNKAPLLGLSYQYVKRQLLDEDTVTIKDAPSYMDAFFKEKISTKKMKDHFNYVQKQKADRLSSLV